MGLFTRDYSRPGPGVDKDAPQKNAFFRFFELFARKIFRYIGFNLMYLVVLLPIVVFLYVNVYTMMFSIMNISPDEIGNLPPMLDLCVMLYRIVPEILHAPIFVISLILYGPFTMGLTYVLRNFVREEHAWTSDFFVKALANWKQGLFFGAIDVLVVVVVYFNWNYSGVWAPDGGLALLATGIRWLTIVVAVFYFFMRFYCYQLAVTVELKISQIIKNSLIFAILGLKRNILATFLVVLVFMISTLAHPFVEVILLPFLTFSLCGFIAVYTTYPIIDKYVVKPALEAERELEDDIPEAVLPPELGGPGAGSLALERLENEAGNTDESENNEDDTFDD